MGGEGQRCRRRRTLEERALLRQAIDVGGARRLVSVASQVIGPERIDADQDQARRVGLSGPIPEGDEEGRGKQQGKKRRPPESPFGFLSVHLESLLQFGYQKPDIPDIGPVALGGGRLGESLEIAHRLFEPIWLGG